ncbi:hypothetical protein JTE90_013987 [Oedothorax gibbosus]|uniref:Uncharacterized protein n=1 Tax=Oedothorax gibbosus TaxID=931172 RepID=A0AAV6UCR4_9ARAC|nr:hypothetical protein JTE90_013987 [Oedothorax gibbosus]
MKLTSIKEFALFLQIVNYHISNINHKAASLHENEPRRNSTPWDSLQSDCAPHLGWALKKYVFDGGIDEFYITLRQTRDPIALLQMAP